MDVPDEGVLDVELLGDDGSEDEGEAPPSSGTPDNFRATYNIFRLVKALNSQ